jgi:hypothetical protein
MRLAVMNASFGIASAALADLRVAANAVSSPPQSPTGQRGLLRDAGDLP